MRFAEPHLLWLLLAVPPALVLFLWRSGRTRRKLAAQFIQARLLPNLVAGVSSRRRKLRAACLVAAVACLLLALAQPQWGYDLEEVTQRGLDIVVAVDTSKSMLAEDIAPNRLERAKLAVLDLMQQAKSDRLGLVAFAGGAFLQCPLTVDDSAFRQSVAALNVNVIPQGGTALAEAIDTALKAFKEGDNYKVLVMFTDGEDHDSGALEAAKKAAAAGLRIFTIGIGSAEGELLRIQGPNGQSDYVRDAQGNVVKSHLDAALLRQIADATHGYYLPLQGANTMDVLYQKCLAPLPKSESKERWVKQARARYQWPLAAAIVLLVAEMFLPERRREARKAAAATGAQRAAVARVGLVLLVCLGLPKAVLGSPSSALREYKSGNYKSALKDYEELLQKHADDPRLHFNAGAAAYRDHQFAEAARHFNQSVLSPDLNLQEQAYYNLGNTLYRMGEQDPDPSKKSGAWEQSLTNYSNSLQLNPQDADAKFNYEYVKKKLEELKKQQQQQQKQNQNQQNQKQKQNQNQNQQQQQNKQDQQSKQKQQNSQRQQPENQKQQEQKHQQSPQQSEQQKKQEQPKREQARTSSGDKKKESQADRNQQSNPAYAAGEMTPQQARQLLDAQKGDEMMLPVKPEGKAPPHRGPIMDW